MRQPRRILARRGAAPLSRPTPTLPVCGTRIMRRTLKRACILRPLHLLRLAVSAAGGARLRSPLQGSLLGGNRLQSLPCKGRWMRRKGRRRGALPLSGGNIRQGPAEPCPVLRRGRCLHRPGNPAVAQGPRGGRNRPPYIAAASGQQRTNASHPPGPLAGRCKHRPLRRGAAGCRSRFRCPVYVTW